MMKNNNLKRGIMALSVFALVGAMSLGNAGTASANPGGGMPPEHNRIAMMRGLDLSDSQKEQIREIYKELRENNREKGREFRDRSKAFDGDLSEKELAEMKTEMSEKMYEGMKAQYQVLQVLTPEQRAKMEEKIKQGPKDREEARQNRRDRYNEKLARELDLTQSQQEKLQKMKHDDREGRDGISFLAEKLDLTFSQKEKIQGILDKDKGKDHEKGREMGRKRMKDMHDLVSASSFDETKAKAMASDAAEEMISRMSERKAMFEEIMKVLDEDQKAEFKEMGRHFQQMGPFGGPSHGRPGRK